MKGHIFYTDAVTQSEAYKFAMENNMQGYKNLIAVSLMLLGLYQKPEMIVNKGIVNVMTRIQ